jgi:DNA polymerase-4
VSVQLGSEQEPQQLGLFSAPTAPPPRSAKLNAALDRIAERFGSKAITTADLVKRDGEAEDEWGRD